MPPHPPQALALIGEFNAWEPRPEHWAIKNDYGVWQLFLPDNADGTSQIVHRWAGGLAGFVPREWDVESWRLSSQIACTVLARVLTSSLPPPGFLPGAPSLPPSCRTKIKVRLETAYGEWVERIPAWIKWATQVGG